MTAAASAVGVAVRHEGDAAGQRLERLAVGRLGGQRERAHGAAVEGALGGDDVGAAGAPGELERGLVGLGAGVGEEDLAGGAPPSSDPSRRSASAHLRLGGEEVRDVAEGLQLGGDRLDQRRVGVAEGVHGDAAEQVEVLLAGVVPDVGALAPGEHQLRRAEGVHQRLGVARLEVAHFESFFSPVA